MVRMFNIFLARDTINMPESRELPHESHSRSSDNVKRSSQVKAHGVRMATGMIVAFHNMRYYISIIY